MALQTSTLMPGLLVNMKSSVTGGVRYEKTVLEEAHRVEETGEQKARWETTRIIDDAEQHKKAGEARSKARAIVARVCKNSSFGLLCPEADSEKLEQAIKDARAVVKAFNAEATLVRVSFFVLTGRIAADDVEAVKAINSEVKELMDAMNRGLENLDVKVVRDAASRAKEIGQMLTADMQARVQIAVEAARAAAKQIAKAGETGAVEIDKSTIRKITEMRTAFLDLDDQGEIAIPAAGGRSIDMAPAAGEQFATFAAKSQPAEIE